MVFREKLWQIVDGALQPRGDRPLSVDSLDVTRFSTGYERIVLLDGPNIRVIDSNGAEVTNSPWDNSANEAQDAINDALSNISADGAVWLAPGDYNYDARITPPANTRLHGTRASKLVAQADDVNCITITNDDVEIRGIQIDGNDRDDQLINFGTCANQRVIDCWIHSRDSSSNGRLIDVGTVTNLLIEGCELHMADSANNSNTTFGINMRGGGSNKRIHNNWIHDMEFNAIALYGDLTEFQVWGNLCENTGHTAISASPAANGSIIGNTVIDVTDAETGGSAGIEVEVDDGHVADTAGKRIAIIGNVVDNCPSGIMTHDRQGDDSDVPTDVHIFSNSITNCTTGRANGIDLRYGDMVHVGKNVLSGNTTDFNTESTMGDYSRGGGATESAAADEPQADWPEGTIVDFTDSDGGSGTGQYVLIDGSWLQLA